MNKHLMSGLILATLLSGCASHVNVAPDAFDVETTVKTGLATTKLPAGTRTVGPKAQAQAPLINMKSPTLTPVLSNKALAAGTTGVAGSDDSASATAHLKVLKSPDGLKLVPIYSDDNQLNSMMASPSDGTLTWSLQAVDGALAIAKVAVVIRREAANTPMQPAPDATSTPPSPPVQQGEPMTFERSATEVGLPESAHNGANLTLKLNLKNDDGKKFLEANPTTARASIKVTLLDDAGKPLLSDNGSALTLDASVTVL
jgi:hypothetical protein